MDNNRTILSVSELNKQAKRLLESHFDYVWLEGEISNFARPSSGHWYLTIKDASAQVRGAMFRNRNQLCRFQPENGQQVMLRARVSLYEGRGEFQLIVEHMELAGDGNLQAAFDKLKRKLSAEGLFDAQYKQQLPDMPATVALVTSGSGAVLHDLKSVFKRRFPLTQLILVNSRVQGEGADIELVAAIEKIQRLDASTCPIDAIVIARGGGSAEDLWSFNSEALARAMFACNIPVVSAVGHETDFTICDFVADERAPTPSAAAELLTPDHTSLQQILRKQESRLLREIQSIIESRRQGLDWLERRTRDPRQRLQDKKSHMYALARRLERAQSHRMQAARLRLSEREGAFGKLSPAPGIRSTQLRLKHLGERLFRDQHNRQAQRRELLGRTSALLAAVSPLATVSRGYSIIAGPDGSVVRGPADVAIGDSIRAQVAGGGLHCTVTDTDTDSIPGYDPTVDVTNR